MEKKKKKKIVCNVLPARPVYFGALNGHLTSGKRTSKSQNIRGHNIKIRFKNADHKTLLAKCNVYKSTG
jgi:hypothetical protein